MVSLRTLQSGIAPFNTTTLLESSMKRFDRPPMGKMIFDRLPIVERQIVGGDVGNVAVRGDELADHDKTIGLELDPVDLFGSPIQVLDMDVLALFHRHQAVTFYLTDPLPVVRIDRFQVSDGGKPGIHKNV